MAETLYKMGSVDLGRHWKSGIFIYILKILVLIVEFMPTQAHTVIKAKYIMELMSIFQESFFCTHWYAAIIMYNEK